MCSSGGSSEVVGTTGESLHISANDLDLCAPAAA